MPEALRQNLIDRDVEILDPATGTGTFIVELMEHFRGQTGEAAPQIQGGTARQRGGDPALLRRQPEHRGDLRAITGQYAEFPDLCSSTRWTTSAALGISGHQHDLFGAMGEENVERIKRQNRRKICVVIGNPPYNANQQNENEQQQEPTPIRTSTAHQGDLHQGDHGAEDQALRHVRAVFPLGSDRLHDDGMWPSSPTAVSSKAAPSTAFASGGREIRRI